MPGPVVQEVEDRLGSKKRVEFEKDDLSSFGTISDRGIDGEALQWKHAKTESIHVCILFNCC